MYNNGLFMIAMCNFHRMLSGRKYNKREFYETYGLNNSNRYYNKIKQEHIILQSQLNYQLAQIQHDTKVAQLRARHKNITQLEKRQVSTSKYTDEYINDAVMYNKYFANIIKSERQQKRSILQQMVNIRRQHREGHYQVKSMSRQENTIFIQELENSNIGRRLKRHNNSPAVCKQEPLQEIQEDYDPIRVVDYQISRRSTKTLADQNNESDIVINCVDNDDLFNCTEEIFTSEKDASCDSRPINSKKEQPQNKAVSDFMSYQQNMHSVYLEYKKQKQEEQSKKKEYKIEDKQAALMLISQVLEEMDTSGNKQENEQTEQPQVQTQQNDS